MDIISGGRAILKVDNTPIGYAGGVNGGQDIAYQPVDALGDLYVKEQVPVGITIRFSANFVRVLNQRYAEVMRVSNDTNNNGQKYLEQNGINAIVEDRISSGGRFISASGLKMQTRNFNLGARALFAEDVSFVGIALDFNDAAATV